MKKLLSLFLCFAILFCASCAPDDPTVTDEPTDSVCETTLEQTTLEETTEAPEPEDVLIYQAHRGYSTKYPENTVLAIEKAIEAGFKICEIDPNFTADGRAVLMHDSTVERTCRRTDGSAISGKVSSYTYAELSKLDAGIFKGEEFKGTRVPLLVEAVRAAEKGGITVKIDNKIQNFSDAEQEIVFMIAEQYPETVGITCKDIEFVKKVINRLPNAIIHFDGAVTEKLCQELKKLVGDNRLYIWYSVADANEKVCNMIKKYGELGLWTVKNAEQLDKAIALGADLIETNGEVIPE